MLVVVKQLLLKIFRSPFVLKTIGDIRNVLHSRLLTTRSMQRLVDSNEFLSIYDDSSEDRKEIARSFIKEGNKDGLDLWLIQQKSIKKKEYAEMSVKDLRKIAQDLGIDGYIYLSKATLLSEIANRERK